MSRELDMKTKTPEIYMTILFVTIFANIFVTQRHKFQIHFVFIQGRIAPRHPRSSIFWYISQYHHLTDDIRFQCNFDHKIVPQVTCYLIFTACKRDDSYVVSCRLWDGQRYHVMKDMGIKL